MRFSVSATLVLCLIAVVLANPANNKKQAAATCSRDCGDNYDPICARAKNGNKERLLTFGNDCVFSNFNCGHADDPYEIKSRGECGGNVSVRLS